MLEEILRDVAVLANFCFCTSEENLKGFLEKKSSETFTTLFLNKLWFCIHD